MLYNICVLLVLRESGCFAVIDITIFFNIQTYSTRKIYSCFSEMHFLRRYIFFYFLLLLLICMVVSCKKSQNPTLGWTIIYLFQLSRVMSQADGCHSSCLRLILCVALELSLTTSCATCLSSHSIIVKNTQTPVLQNPLVAKNIQEVDF